MIPLDSLALFALACVLLALTPGPNLMYLISRTLCRGRSRHGVAGRHDDWILVLRACRRIRPYRDIRRDSVL
jgi:hypothetical protein